jgi:hypothetical protein
MPTGPSLPFAALAAEEKERAAWLFPVWLRLLMIGGGGVLVTLLIVARLLQPSADGFGTHQQLGLPPCSSQQLFGFRCPACGMTTSWAHLTRGQVWSSLSVNAGGTLLGIAAAVCGPWLMLSGMRGRWFGNPPHEMVVLGICLTVAGVILVDWMCRLCSS